MPISGWKYMIYSMFKVINLLKINNTIEQENIIMTRFDISCNSYSKDIEYITSFIEKYKHQTEEDIVFANGVYYLHCGCENLMLGKPKALYELNYNMWNYTDDLLLRHPNSISQEFYFIYEYKYIKSNKEKQQLNLPDTPINIIETPTVITDKYPASLSNYERAKYYNARKPCSFVSLFKKI